MCFLQKCSNAHSPMSMRKVGSCVPPEMGFDRPLQRKGRRARDFKSFTGELHLHGVEETVCLICIHISLQEQPSNSWGGPLEAGRGQRGFYG